MKIWQTPMRWLTRSCPSHRRLNAYSFRKQRSWWLRAACCCDAAATKQETMSTTTGQYCLNQVTITQPSGHSTKALRCPGFRCLDGLRASLYEPCTCDLAGLDELSSLRDAGCNEHCTLCLRGVQSEGLILPIGHNSRGLQRDSRLGIFLHHVQRHDLNDGVSVARDRSARHLHRFDPGHLLDVEESREFQHLAVIARSRRSLEPLPCLLGGC